MSITDELRKWGRATLADTSLLARMEAIADRIDAEHQKALDEWKAEHGKMWLKGYSECHAELLEGNETLASDLERCGWIRLPKDADGEPIHVGDVMNKGKVTCIRDCGKGWEVVLDNLCMYDAPSLHHRKPTVEDVLTEFGIDWEHENDCEDRAALLKEYASKLRLAEGEDA